MSEKMRFERCENFCTDLCPHKNNRSININESYSGKREIIITPEADTDEMEKLCLECPDFVKRAMDRI